MNARERRWSSTTVFLIVVVVLLLLAPHVLNRYRVYQIENLALYASVTAGLAVAVSYTGLISVGHAALMTAGAYTAALLSVNHGLTMLLSLAAGMAVAALIGLALAVPSGRLGHFYFAMVTLGLGLVGSQLIQEWDSWTGGFSGVLGIEDPDLLGVELGPTAFYYVLLALVGLMIWVVVNVVRGGWGRQFLLVRHHEVAASAAGIDVYRTKLRAFTLSAVPAGLAGGLFAYLNGTVTPVTFDFHLGLLLLMAVAVGGLGVAGPVVGAIVIFFVPEFLRDYRVYTDLVFGGLLILVLTTARGGVQDVLARLRDLAEYGRRRRGRGTDVTAVGELDLHHVPQVPDFVVGAPRALQVDGVTKSFFGIRALDDVSIRVEPGSVVAVIGPNGSGKTTLLNIISGFYHPDEGMVRLGDEVISGRPPHAVARRGVGRTFQTPRVVHETTVIDNVLVGMGPRGRVPLVVSAVGGGRRGRRLEAMAREQAHELLTAFDLQDRAGFSAGDLPHPHLRFVEICRTLAGTPGVVMLDEPAAGLSPEEMAHLGRTVRALAERGLTVIMVEHNIGLVMDVADRVVVLDAGVIVADDTAERVATLPEVAAVYLGEEYRPDGSASPGASRGAPVHGSGADHITT